MMILTASVFFVTIGKMHVLSWTDLSAYADNANAVTEKITALRGNIYDHDGQVIAQDNRTYNIVCILDENRPHNYGQVVYVQDKAKTARILSDILKIDYNKVLDYLKQDIYQTELGNGGRNLSKSVRDEIERYDLPGIEFTDSVQRVYPLGVFASNLIGYAQSSDTGQMEGKMGLELYLNSWLKGRDGERTYQVDKNGYILPGMKEEITSARNGNNVYLTLDQNIQAALESSFAITRDRFHPDRTWGAVMEINTGRILAWGQSPSFDPNKLEIKDYNNFGAELPYEPGSTFKTFTWAAAINEGVYEDKEIYSGSEFCYTVDDDGRPKRTTRENAFGCIANARRHDWGMTTYDHGLIYSANTIAMSVLTEMIDPDIHVDYLKRFGFWQPVDTDGLPEEKGTLTHRYPSEQLALSYGQGSSVTMLQLLQAYSAVFSDGKMKKPYFVESIRDSYDPSKVYYQAETKIVGEPITDKTAKQLQKILYHVVNDEDGTAKWYQIPECKLIGKTGTTEVAENGAYRNKTITSLMAALPADNPQIMVYYCFEANYDPGAHVDSEAVVSLLRKVAMTYGFNEEEKTEPASGDGEDQMKEIVTVSMPNVLNHSVKYAEKKLNSIDTEVYVLGKGSTVIDQFPAAGDPVSTDQKTFILTDTSSFEMPDMTGWTRKDVTGLWAVTGFGFQLEGTGTVAKQSIPPGTSVTKGTEIRITFE